jgi:hypothetical protein
VFSVVSAAFVATQRCGKHISAAVNHQATIEDMMFSLGVVPKLYNEDLTQLQRIIIEKVSGVGRIMARKE